MKQIDKELQQLVATLCIEKSMLDEIDIDNIISDFPSQNMRRFFEGICNTLLDMHLIFSLIQIISTYNDL
mgnify:CR=1 FL=1